jgi:hypothetical protein
MNHPIPRFLPLPEKKATPFAYNGSIPWRDDQMIAINGERRFVYTVDSRIADEEERIDVKMPGGMSMTVKKLRALGYVVGLPNTLRIDPPAVRKHQQAAA